MEHDGCEPALGSLRHRPVGPGARGCGDQARPHLPYIEGTPVGGNKPGVDAYGIRRLKATGHDPQGAAKCPVDKGGGPRPEGASVRSTVVTVVARRDPIENSPHTPFHPTGDLSLRPDPTTEARRTGSGLCVGRRVMLCDS